MDLKGAKIRNIFQLCSDMGSDLESKLRVNIPYYQRPYKWEQEYIENLINDFFKYGKSKDSDSNNEYFVGSIVAVSNKDSHDIIDGQQRITTVYLVAYIKFLLQRSYIEEVISNRKDFMNINNYMRDLDSFYSQVIVSKKDLDYIKKEVEKRVVEISDLQSDQSYANNRLEEKDQKQNDLYDKLLKFYRERLKLPTTKKLEVGGKYEQQYTKELENLIGNEKLSLRYSRESLNTKLNDSLTKVCIKVSSSHSPEIKISEEYDKEDKIIERYVQSMKYIFNAFSDQCKSEEDPLKRTKKMIEKMNDFLKNLKFCVIVTATPDDAYTLFEVLNDRALAISDLDLVKNLFYKKYVLSDKEGKKDDNLEKLETIWGEKIFTDNRVTQHKLILYLATAYFTGDEDIDSNNNCKYRKAIEDKYLNKIYEKDKNNYEFTNISDDFKIFEFIKIILDKFEFVYQKKNVKAFESEMDMNKSITFKTLHLLNALGQESIIAAIVNLILKTFIKENSKKTLYASDFETFIDNLINVKGEKNDPYVIIHQLSHNIWRLSLLSKSYEIPRKFSKRVVKKINYSNEDDGSSLKLSSDDIEESKKEFKEWIEAWTYGSSRNFKVTMLFLILLGTTKQGTKLKIANSNIGLVADKINLDHLEASNPDDLSKAEYFTPEGSISRETYTNKLGNFMVLDGESNIKKSNRPTYKAIEFYNDSGQLGRNWLLEEFIDLLEDDNYSKQVDIAGSKIRVPTEEFFITRSKNLQKYFLNVISRKFGINEIEV